MTDTYSEEGSRGTVQIFPQYLGTWLCAKDKVGPRLGCQEMAFEDWRRENDQSNSLWLIVSLADIVCLLGARHCA